MGKKEFFKALSLIFSFCLVISILHGMNKSTYVHPFEPLAALALPTCIDADGTGGCDGATVTDTAADPDPSSPPCNCQNPETDCPTDGIYNCEDCECVWCDECNCPPPVSDEDSGLPARVISNINLLRAIDKDLSQIAPVKSRGYLSEEKQKEIELKLSKAKKSKPRKPKYVKNVRKNKDGTVTFNIDVLNPTTNVKETVTLRGRTMCDCNCECPAGVMLMGDICCNIDFTTCMAKGNCAFCDPATRLCMNKTTSECSFTEGDAQNTGGCGSDAICGDDCMCMCGAVAMCGLCEHCDDVAMLCVCDDNAECCPSMAGACPGGCELGTCKCMCGVPPGCGGACPANKTCGMLDATSGAQCPADSNTCSCWGCLGAGDCFPTSALGVMPVVPPTARENCRGKKAAGGVLGGTVPCNRCDCMHGDCVITDQNGCGP